MKSAEPALSFAIRYHWIEASVPPPDHYEWIIEIQGQQGKITFFPDYPQHGVAPWVKTFAVSKSQIDQILAACHKSRVFRTRWAEPPQPSVGGPQDDLTVWLDGQTYSVPATRTTGASRALEPLWKIIRACVPQSIWDQLFGLREEYIRQAEK